MYIQVIIRYKISQFGIFVNGGYNSIVGSKLRTNNEQKILQILLKQVRLEANLRQLDLAGKLNMPQSFVSKYESGERRLDLVELKKICDVIGLSLEEFTKRFEEELK